MILGREKEINLLNELEKENKSSFIAIYGRRRIGKTYLVQETFNDRLTFRTTGLYKGTKQEELFSFMHSFPENFLNNCDKPKNWIEAFTILEKYLSSNKDKKKIIFIDEISWLAESDSSGFMKGLDFFWNGFASWRKDIMLIVSASATAWILNHIVHDKGGFYHRLTNSIKLEPFSLKECKEFAKALNLNYSDKAILDAYMVFGGVPYYWNLLSPKMSLVQNIDKLLFSSSGELVDEFSYAFSSLFINPGPYLKIMQALGEKRKGMTRKELIEKTGEKENGLFLKD